MTPVLDLLAAGQVPSILLALMVILAACRLGGALARYLGQPPVVAEMIVGVVLGPSILGALLPAVGATLFPYEVREVLRHLSTVGLALYMFSVGAEVRSEMVLASWRTSASVSLAGLLAPFGLGAALGVAAVSTGGFFTAIVKPWEGAFFLGAALCITAFPMLARIIRTEGLAATRMGTVALGAGAIDDVAAWVLVAAVVASTTGDGSGLYLAVGGGIAFALVVRLVVRPALAVWGRRANARGVPHELDLPGLVILALAGGYCTEVIGLHAVFGAFLVGAALPKGVLQQVVRDRLEPLVTVLLLPIFFTYSGLQTELPTLLLPGVGLLLLGVLAAAIVGKAVACTAAARVGGLSWREAGGIGALMNARGLMELIVINIGLQAQLITESLFAVLVVMAILTTLMATPLFRLVRGRSGEPAAVRA